MRRIEHRREDSAGNALIIVFLLISLLTMLSLAEFSVVKKNQDSSAQFASLLDLRNCAESGVVLALHDMKTNASGNSGDIGLNGWTEADDAGVDGIGSTSDEGEGDGIPTPGEPNTTAVSIGASSLDAAICVKVFDLGGDLRRITSTVVSPVGMVTVEKIARRKVPVIPKIAALLVDPNVVLDFRGNRFNIDGNDHNVDGTAGSGDSLFGLATLQGETAGDNAAALLAQVPVNAYDQIHGAGSDPSVGESTGDAVDLQAIFNSFKANNTHELTTGTYTDLDLEDTAGAEFPIAYASDGLHLSGNGYGRGVLVVEGDLTITGTFTFEGLVIVNGDVRLSGGGSTIHSYGSLMVTDSIIAIDEENDLDISGNADIFYSEAALDAVTNNYQGAANYVPVYHKE
jgi:hypothetical protein